MAFDACMMRAVLSELKREFPEAKIEKVLQPRNDEIDLVLHHGKVSRRLVFNVGPNAPRLQLSDVQKENPQAAPMFCMLLRKLFVGAKIVEVNQPDFDILQLLVCQRLYRRICIEHTIPQPFFPSIFFHNFPEQIIEVFYLYILFEFFEICYCCYSVFSFQTIH